MTATTRVVRVTCTWTFFVRWQVKPASIRGQLRDFRAGLMTAQLLTPSGPAACHRDTNAVSANCIVVVDVEFSCPIPAHSPISTPFLLRHLCRAILVFLIA